jgi:hypothetical protein
MIPVNPPGEVIDEMRQLPQAKALRATAKMIVQMLRVCVSMLESVLDEHEKEDQNVRATPRKEAKKGGSVGKST